MKGKQHKKKSQAGKSSQPEQNIQVSFDVSKWGALICFIIGFLLYSNTFQHYWVLDDYGVLKDNWVVKSGTEGISTILTTPYRYGVNHLSDNLYRPLSQVMFAIEWQFSPNNPGLHHIINVLFYALSCGLLFLFLKKLLPQVHPFIPMAISLLYTFHPIHTEVVANIKSRDEIMSFFFVILTGMFLIDYYKKYDVKKLLIAAVMFGLSMFSKEGAVTMVVIFPLLGWYFFNADLKKMIISGAALLVPSLLYILVRQQIISAYSTSDIIAAVDNILVDAKDPVTRFATAIMLMGKYLWQMVFPSQLVCDYSFKQLTLQTLSSPSVWLSILIHAGLLFIVFKEWKQKTLLSFGILFYLLTMSLYSNIVLIIGTSFAERLLYQPSLGFAIIVVAALNRLFNLKYTGISSIRDWLLPNTSFAALLIFVCLLMGWKTVVRAAEWKNQYTLFSLDVQRSPESAHMRLYYGLAVRDSAMGMEKAGKMMEYGMMMQKALNEFETGINIYPNYVDCLEQAGLANYRLSKLNNDNPGKKREMEEKALKYYNETLRLFKDKPVTLSNLGTLYFERGEYQRALELFQRAVKKDPRYEDAWFNLGSSYGITGQYEKALDAFNTCIGLDPEYWKSYEFKAMTYDNMKQPDKAKSVRDQMNRLKNKK
jgi:tetratricopeptide (TPR) repeat protein